MIVKMLLKTAIEIVYMFVYSNKTLMFCVCADKEIAFDACYKCQNLT